MKLKRRNQKRKVISRIRILLITVLLLLTGILLFSEKVENIVNVEGNKTQLYATSTSKLTSIITASDYGKTIDYSVTVNGTTYNDWKVLYNDGTNVQIIMSDFLPQSGIPSAALSAGLEKVTFSGKTTYNVYSTVSRDKLLSGLTSGWEDFAKGVNGAMATGAPTLEVVESSFQQKYGEVWSASISVTDTLYVPHISSYDGCKRILVG